MNKEISTDLRSISVPHLHFLSLEEDALKLVEDDRNIAGFAPSDDRVLYEVVFLPVLADLVLQPSLSGVNLALKAIDFVDVFLLLNLQLNPDVLILRLKLFCEDFYVIYVSFLLQFHLKKLSSCLIVLLYLQSQLFFYCCILFDVSLENVIERNTSFFL